MNLVACLVALLSLLSVNAASAQGFFGRTLQAKFVFKICGSDWCDSQPYDVNVYVSKLRKAFEYNEGKPVFVSGVGTTGSSGWTTHGNTLSWVDRQHGVISFLFTSTGRSCSVTGRTIGPLARATTELSLQSCVIVDGRVER